jgi:hypothetical protein
VLLMKTSNRARLQRLPDVHRVTYLSHISFMEKQVEQYEHQFAALQSMLRRNDEKRMVRCPRAIGFGSGFDLWTQHQWCDCRLGNAQEHHWRSIQRWRMRQMRDNLITVVEFCGIINTRSLKK